MNHDNNMRGAIWANTDKQKDTHPDFKGNATINGVDYWVSAWKRKEGASDRAPILSFSFTQKEEKPADTASYSSPEVTKKINDEIPF